MRRALAALVVAAASLQIGAAAADAQQSPANVLVFVVRGSTFVDFSNDPLVAGIHNTGGVAMLRGPNPAIGTIESLRTAGIEVVDIAAADDASSIISDAVARFDDDVLVVVVGLSPSSGPAAEGPDSVLVASGLPADLGGSLSDAPAPTLTSDSTRRHGIVTPDDVVTTIESFVGRDLVSGGGEPVRVVQGPPPLALYERYLQYRELSAPIQIGVGIWEVGIGALAFAALRGRRRAFLRFALGGVLSVPVLFIALLLVGHLPSLTYATVVLTLSVVTAVAWITLVRVVERRGIGSALAWSGGIGLGGLVLESLLGWTAAFAPMLGGSQLDGFRSFGLPNAFLGLAVGGAVLLATRTRSTTMGAWLIAAVGLWAGAPWFGADIGGAVTLFAAAGLWWGIRNERGWIRTGVITVACVAIGAALVIFAHLFLTDAPTHITRFAENSGGINGIVEKAIDRLEIGLRLVADQPPALVPVVGTLIALVLVLWRPPPALRAGFALEPDTRPAALTILLASVVAYLANDTGAAALGLGFGTAMVTLFAVSLAAATEKMDA